jgi:UDP-N-acetylenolpyruvoylglucosamine reductase
VSGRAEPQVDQGLFASSRCAKSGGPARGWLIEHAGFHKGERLGRAGLSSRHALAIVAHAGARAGDVVALARRIRARVDERFGVRLVPEPVFWGFLSLDGGLPDERIA